MNSKSLEELLSILEASEDKVERLPSEIEMFIRDFELVPSEEKIRSTHIYWIYLNWKEAGNGEEKALMRDMFFRQFKKHFKAGRVGKYRYYFVSGENFAVSRGQRLELMEDLKQERQHRQWLKERLVKKGT